MSKGESSRRLSRWLLIGLAAAGCQGFPGTPTCETAADCDPSGRYACNAEGQCVAASGFGDVDAGPDTPGPDGQAPDARPTVPDARPTVPDAHAPAADAGPIGVDLGVGLDGTTSDAAVLATDATPPVPDAHAPTPDAHVPPTPDAAEPPTPDAHVPQTPDAGTPPTPDAAAPPTPDAAEPPTPDAAPIDPCAEPGAPGACELPEARPECRAGHFVCDGPEPVCVSDLNQPELCDGLDNDCNGTIDDSPTDPDLGQSCYDLPEGAAEVGQCRSGLSACSAGEVVCVDAVGPADEVCNGLDDDCDGTPDETDPALCTPCVVAGASGACAAGVSVCLEGALACRPSLTASPAGSPCDLADNDCDGQVDEENELVDARTAVPEVVAQCPDREHPPWDGRLDHPGACEGGAELGCARPHACLEAGCLATCETGRGTAISQCAATCAAEATPAVCLADCLGAAAAGWATCLSTCEAPEGAARFTCVDGPAGATCTVTACEAGFERRHGRCVRVEICNNGLDEDEDGVVDATLDPEFERCAVAIPTLSEAEQAHWGYCDQTALDLGLPGCEDNARFHVWDGEDDETCVGAACPKVVTLSYDYAVDKEEVSNRAYWQCVTSGCCLPPVGGRYTRAAADLEAGVAPPRPEAPERCEPAPRIDLSGAEAEPLVADLPVTGVSWCQARDYCAWAGKRLLTDFEWERAGAGPYPDRRGYAWGVNVPGMCEDAQCCHAPDWVPADGAPADCDFDHLAVCPEGTPMPPSHGVRHACLGTWGSYNPECSLRSGEATGLISPAPVWANEDGATPTGLLNMNTNVMEWLDDWQFEDLGARQGVDPVGPGCSQAGPVPVKTLRGGTYTSVPGDIATQNRAGILPWARLSTIGFRCGRTLAEDADGAPARCDAARPGAPGFTCNRAEGDPVCAGPDFQTAEDTAACPGGVRQHPVTCEDGAPAACHGDTPFDCTRLTVTEMTLDPGALASKLALLALLGIQVPGEFITTPRGVSVVTDAILSDSAQNGGGSTLFFDVPCNVGVANQAAQARLVNGVQEDGQLFESGRVNQATGLCDLPAGDTFPLVSRPGVPRFDNFCADTMGTLTLRALGIDLQYSGVLLLDAGRVSPNAPFEAAGVYNVVVRRRDAHASYVGAQTGPAVSSFFETWGLQETNLCFFEQMATALQFANPLLVGNWSCAAWLEMPGCNHVTHACETPEECMGYVLPFTFRAEEPVPGVLGRANCDCQP